MGLRFEQVMAIGAAGVLGLAALPASAQLSGGPIVPAMPGQFSMGTDIGITGTVPPRFVFGDNEGFGPAPTFTGFTRSNLFNTDTPLSGLNGSISGSWGLPGGLFGAPTEIWARFSALDSSGQKNTSGGGSTFVPYLDGRQRQPFNGIAPPAFLAFVTIGGNSETLDRNQTTYSAEVGVRTHLNFGSLRISPGAFVGYDRLNEHDKITQSINTGDVPFFSLDTQLKSDYYRFGLGLGTSLPVTIIGSGVSWFT